MGVPALLVAFGMLLLPPLRQPPESASQLETATSEPSPTEETGVEAGDIAPDFRLASLDLAEVTLSEHRGRHNVLLNFFATWCGPCREEMPGVQSQFEKHAEHDWIVIAISIQEPARDVVAFRDELGLTFPLALDSRGHVAYEYAVTGTPTNIIIDKQGRILDRRLGYMAEDEIEAMIEAVP